MPTFECIRTYRKLMVTALWLAALTAAARPSFAQDKAQEIYTYSDTSIKDFQNKLLRESVANDRKVFLGSIGSDLWHGPQDARSKTAAKKITSRNARLDNFLESRVARIVTHIIVIDLSHSLSFVG